MSIPQHLLDPTLKAAPCLFHRVCFPFRVALALALIFGAPWAAQSGGAYLQTIGAMLVVTAAGLAYKWSVNPKSWKNYMRPVTLYPVVGFILLFVARNDHTANFQPTVVSSCGMILLIDALLGQQSHYIAETYMNA
jgi:hypothetical protein